MKAYAIYSPAGGPGRKRIIRRGLCQDGDLALQAQPGEAVVEAAADHVEQDLFVPADGSPPHLIPRLAADLAAHRARFATTGPTEPSEAEVVFEALKKKHGLTSADLAAARQDILERRQARQAGPAP